jgi:hypothetical protein
MKKLFLSLLLLVFSSPILFATPDDNGFVTGEMEVKSINALAFGPENILFIGDSKSAKIYALKVDISDSHVLEDIQIENIDVKIANQLGVPLGEISIQDMAVHQASGNIFLAVHHLNNPVLFKLNPSGELLWIPFDSATYAEKSVSNAVEQETKDRRGRSLRRWAISDLHFDGSKLMVTGLSNREFGSTFRSLNYPFTDEQQDASLEIYHAAHGQFETHAPVKTFTTAELNGKSYLIASYTCTPLVLFPLEELDEGEHHKGRTVAELGAGNTPLDMVIVEKEGRRFLLMNNTNRPVMKISLDDIAGYQGMLEEPVEVPGATEGVEYINFPMVNVVQMDNWGKDNWLMLKRDSDGPLNIRSGSQFWL